MPYHNAIHAADVLARFCALINSDGIMLGSSTEDKLMILAAILAAIVHDFQHPGLSNAYQIAVETDICREFNEQHVLENLSIKRALEMMRSPRYNFTYRMRTVHRRALHSNMITLVCQVFPWFSYQELLSGLCCNLFTSAGVGYGHEQAL